VSATVWITIAVLCVGTVAIKALGPATVGGREPSERTASVIRLVAPALLAALVTYETFNPAGGHGVTIDARVVGVGTAAVGLVLKLPLIVVVLAAAAATAAVRALT
jgi:hypothetical protein